MPIPLSAGPPSEEELAVIEQLSERLDLVALMAQVGKKTRYGKKPHSTDQWGHTKQFLATYAKGTDVEEVRQLFGRLGAEDEVEAARYLGLHAKYIP